MRSAGRAKCSAAGSLATAVGDRAGGGRSGTWSCGWAELRSAQQHLDGSMGLGFWPWSGVDFVRHPQQQHLLAGLGAGGHTMQHHPGGKTRTALQTSARVRAASRMGRAYQGLAAGGNPYPMAADCGGEG